MIQDTLLRSLTPILGERQGKNGEFHFAGRDTETRTGGWCSDTEDHAAGHGGAENSSPGLCDPKTCVLNHLDVSIQLFFEANRVLVGQRVMLFHLVSDATETERSPMTLR